MSDVLSSDTFREVAEEFRRNRASIRPVPKSTVVADRASYLLDRIMRVDTLAPNLQSHYLVKGWLEQGAFSVVYGESGAGKTFFAVDLALHVGAGLDWHGSRVLGGKVIYIAAEGGGGIANRIAAMKCRSPDLVESADLYFVPMCVDLYGSSDARSLIEVASCLGDPPSLIVVDTLARVIGEGDENSARDMGRLVRNIDLLRRTLRCHVLLVHHTGKDRNGGARGSSALRAAVDTEIELKRSDGVIEAVTRKQRDIMEGKRFAFRIEKVEIGSDEDGDPVTSAVVMESEPVRNEVGLKGQNRVALKALDDALKQHGVIVPGEPFPDGQCLVNVDQWRNHCVQCGLTSGKDGSAFRQAFGRVSKALQEKGLICMFDGHVWKVPDDLSQRDEP